MSDSYPDDDSEGESRVDSVFDTPQFVRRERVRVVQNPPRNEVPKNNNEISIGTKGAAAASALSILVPVIFFFWRKIR